jgi:hexosaminidase
MICLLACTQKTNNKFDPKGLQINWQLIKNNYQGKPQFLSALTLTNTDSSIFPASGWKIYFNCIREIPSASVTGHVQIEHVNGDIFQLKPLDDFSELKPNDSVRIEFVSLDPALNISDAPSGWYLVWDAVPSKGFSLGNYSIQAIEDSSIGLLTPQKIFAQNQNISDIAIAHLPKVFPTPSKYMELPGEFLVTSETKIVTHSAFEKEANYLANELHGLLGKAPAVVANAQGKSMITLEKNNSPLEAYVLEVRPGGIKISASSGVGIFYGIQSIKTLIDPSSWGKKNELLKIPALRLEDGPRFGFRSLMLDVARNFQPKSEILKILDLMALLKLNNLHIHFSDDEGWRIQIPGLPELTEIGARRGHSLDSKDFLPASFADGPDPDHSFGSGFYSRSDFIDILKYATLRHISVISEIESPGHARAAIKAMDVRYERFSKMGNNQEAVRYLLRDTSDRSKYSGAQLWTDNVICVALPSVYRFMEKVTDELILMYKEANAPLNTLHFGGDEVPAGVWENSPACLELIKTDSSLHSVDELWTYYYGKLDQMLRARGLYLSGWEEAGLHKIMVDGQKESSPNPSFAKDNFHLHVWNNMIGWGNEDLPYRLANAGYKVILSCVSNQYFDLSYNKTFEEPGYYWGGFVDIDKPFYFIPFDYYKNSKEDRKGDPIDQSYFASKERLTAYGKSNIVGIQGLLWSENIRGSEKFEYMLLPKLLGMAERAWATDPLWATEKDSSKSSHLYLQSWSVFVNQVGKRVLPILDYYHGGFVYRLPTAGATVENGFLKANTQFPGLTIRYTSDGSEPTEKSKAYEVPINEKGLIILKVFNAKGRSSRPVEIQTK